MTPPPRNWSQSLLSLISWPARALEARRDLALLASLDDRGLADIGLSRQDLRDATAYAAHDDPLARLAERARERAELALARRAPPRPPRSPARSSAPVTPRAA